MASSLLAVPLTVVAVAPVLAALAVAWTAAAAALAARGCRRFARELAAERDRLA